MELIYNHYQEVSLKAGVKIPPLTGAQRDLIGMEDRKMVLVTGSSFGKTEQPMDRSFLAALAARTGEEPLLELDSMGWLEDQSHRRRFPKEPPGRYIGRHAHSNSKTKMEQRRKNSKAARKARKKSK